MKRIWSVVFGKECPHEDTLVVQSVGVRREVCESCGNVSFAIQPSLVEIDYDLPEVAGL